MVICQSFYLNGKIFDYIIVYFAFLCALLNIKQFTGRQVFINSLAGFIFNKTIINI